MMVDKTYISLFAFKSKICMIKLSFIIACFFLVLPFLSSQVGINLYGGTYTFSERIPYVSNGSGAKYGTALGLGLDYDISIMHQKLFLRPHIAFAKLGDLSAADFKNGGNTFAVAANVVVYPFNLLSDCDCPDFSESKQKQNDFFVVIAPTADFMKQKFSYAKAANEVKSFEGNRDLALGLKLGIGMDFNFSENIIFTPTIAVQYTPNVFSPGLRTNDVVVSEVKNISDNYKTIRAELRLGYILNNTNKKSKRR
jgi:hypothetical protein